MGVDVGIRSLEKNLHQKIWDVLLGDDKSKWAMDQLYQGGTFIDRVFPNPTAESDTRQGSDLFRLCSELGSITVWIHEPLDALFPSRDTKFFSPRSGEWNGINIARAEDKRRQVA